MLPFPVDYLPYTGDHVVGQLQLLMFGALAFALLMLSGIYPAEIRSINLDTDWVYRKGGRLFFYGCDRIFNNLNQFCDELFARRIPGLLRDFFADPSRNIQRHFVRLGAEAQGNESNVPEQNRKIESRTRAQAYPIGDSVFLAVIFFAIMSLLFFD
jgi:multicomponent Na+:H+ antiporter subunit D